MHYELLMFATNLAEPAAAGIASGDPF